MKIHPSDAFLGEFLSRSGSSDRKLVVHLATCRWCRERLGLLLGPDSAPEAFTDRGRQEFDYRLALDRSMAGVEGHAVALEVEKLEAPVLCAALMRAPLDRREERLKKDSRYHTWSVCERLIQMSRETGFQDPAHAEEIAQYALLIPGFIDHGRYPAGILEDLRAHAWASIGNARRIASDLSGSATALRTAASHLARGTGDSIEQAVLFDVEASLLRDQRRFREARDLLRRAIALFLEAGEELQAGRCLVNLSTVHEHAASPERAIQPLKRALKLMGAGADPKLLLCARHNLATNLADSGRFQEAWSFYRLSRPLYRSFSDAWTRNRRLWLLGKIALGLGRRRIAETLFNAAREGFIFDGIPYDTALVSLDLALLYARQGRTDEVQRLADETIPIFASRQITREALVVLVIIKQALASQKLSNLGDDQ